MASTSPFLASQLPVDDRGMAESVEHPDQPTMSIGISKTGSQPASKPRRSVSSVVGRSRSETSAADVLDSQALMSHLISSGLAAELAQVLAAVPVPLPSCAGSDAMPAEAEAGWWHIFGFLNVDRLREEVGLARMAAERDLNPETQRRLVALTAALSKVLSGEPDGVDLAA